MILSTLVISQLGHWRLKLIIAEVRRQGKTNNANTVYTFFNTLMLSFYTILKNALPEVLLCSIVKIAFKTRVKCIFTMHPFKKRFKHNSW